MAIFELKSHRLERLPSLNFYKGSMCSWFGAGRLLDAYIEVLAPGTLVLSADYCPSHSDGQVVLGIDRFGDLVLVEFRNEQVRPQLELRVLRLATLASSLTFAQLVALHREYLKTLESDADARQQILDFLGWRDIENDRLGQNVRIVLAATLFSADVTSAVMWLNEHGLDLRCIRLSPHLAGERLLLEVEQLVPPPEVPTFRALVRDREQAARDGEVRRYSVKLGEVEHVKTASRWAIWHVIKELVDAGVNPCLSQVVLRSSQIVRS